MTDPKPARWVRDGTIIASGTQIDLRCTRKDRRTGEYDWISVKSDSDRRCEKIAAQLLSILNDEVSHG